MLGQLDWKVEWEAIFQPPLVHWKACISLCLPHSPTTSQLPPRCPCPRQSHHPLRSLSLLPTVISFHMASLIWEARKMALWLSTGWCYRKPWFSSQHPNDSSTTVCNSSSRWSNTFFRPLLALHAHGAQAYIQGTHPYTRNKNKPFWLKKAHYETHQLVLSRHGLVSPAMFPPFHCILGLMRIWAPWRSHTSHCSTTHPRSLLLYVKHAYNRWFHVSTWVGH